MFKRRFNTSKQNNVIIYQSTQREVPKTVTDTLGGWGANYVDSKSTWDSTSGIGYLYFDGIITRIPDKVFEQNSTMIAILHIPETVTSLGEKLFYFSESGTTLKSKLQRVNFNNGLKFIGARAFQNNRNFEKTILPNSIEYIYQYSFNCCAQKLDELTIGENFKKFLNSGDTPSKNNASGVFGLCYLLKTVHWNAINCEDFISKTYSPFTIDSMGITPPITTVTFGDNVKNIPNYLFYECSNLTGTIELPETLEKVNNTCFYKTNINKVIWNPTNITIAYNSTSSPFSLQGMGQTTSSIKYVRFGENVKTIPCALFWKCENITNDIVIHENVTTIGNRAFQACHGIKHVICRSITPPNIIPQDKNIGWTGSSCLTNVVFKYFDNSANDWFNLPKLEIYVPEISINEYKNDENWAVYVNEIKPTPQPIFDNFNGIDLGLKDEYGEPIIFADKNIGANNPEDIGYYFQWGDNTGYTEENIVNNIKQFDWNTYPYSNNGTTTMTKYNSSDGETKLRLCDDGAFMYTGGKWRMPTIDELMLLTDETKIQIEWVNLNGDVVETPISGDIKGLRFTSKISGYEGNSIFIPASGTAGSGGIPNGIRDVYTSGSIWSSNVLTSDYTKCDALYFTPQNNNLIIDKTSYERFYGRQIRGVLIK